MKDKFFFDIPVYRCSPAKFKSETDEIVDKARRADIELVRKHGSSPEDAESKADELFGPRRNQIRSYVWRFNEIIGWIRLAVWEYRITVQYWFVNAKRIPRGLKNKSFQCEGVPDQMCIIDSSMSSAQIFQKVREVLDLIQKERRYAKRYIDLETFYNAGEHINWRTLIGLEADPPLLAGPQDNISDDS